ncbi:hypothetical protein Tco_0700333 [Tanacetum coccineum]
MLPQNQHSTNSESHLTPRNQAIFKKVICCSENVQGRQNHNQRSRETSPREKTVQFLDEVKLLFLAGEQATALIQMWKSTSPRLALNEE